MQQATGTRWMAAVAAGAAVAAVLVAGPGGVAAVAQEAAPAPTKIGFVNVKKVLHDYKKTEAENKRLRAQRARYQKKVEDLADEEKQKRDKLELLPPGTVKYEELKREVLKLEQEIKFEREWSNYRIGAEYAAATVDVYKDLLHTVKDYAGKHGYGLVLKIEDEDIKADSMVEVNIRINGRAVLFYDESHNLTPAVLKELNDKFVAENPDAGTDEGDKGGDKGGDTGSGGDKKPGNGAGG